MVKRNVHPYTLFRLWSRLVVAEFIIMDLALKNNSVSTDPAHWLNTSSWYRDLCYDYLFPVFQCKRKPRIWTCLLLCRSAGEGRAGWPSCWWGWRDPPHSSAGGEQLLRPQAVCAHPPQVRVSLLSSSFGAPINQFSPGKTCPTNRSEPEWKIWMLPTAFSELNTR